jgi:hypothetical protein
MYSGLQASQYSPSFQEHRSQGELQLATLLWPALSSTSTNSPFLMESNDTQEPWFSANSGKHSWHFVMFSS